MYTFQEYGRMLADHVRMDAYLEALRRTVFPGCVVVDLGSGPGVFALYACKLGARRVYAIEPDESIQLARELAVANSFTDRIVTLEDFSTHITLPEKADVIVSDLRGVLPFFRRSIASILDARDRFLTPGGVLIPRRDVLWGSIVNLPDTYQRTVGVWDQPGLDMSAARIRAVNTISKVQLKSADLLVSAREMGFIDYARTTSPRFSANCSWNVERSGVAHGLGVWFQTMLVDGVVFSNGPDRADSIYGSAFFPFSQPQLLEPGDKVTCELKVDPCGDDYLWRWQTSFESGSSGIRLASFAQSTFHATLLRPNN